MLSFHVKLVQKDRRTDRQTDGQTDNGKTICPRYGGINNFFFLTLCHTISTFNKCKEERLRKIVGKGDNTGNQHFLLFLQSYQPFEDNFYHYSHI